MKRILFIALLILHHPGLLLAQHCGTSELNKFVYDNHPGLHALHLKADSLLNAIPAYSHTQTNNSGSGALVVNGVHHLPVVVHVIHRGEPLGSFYNPTDQQIIDMITSANLALAANFPGYPSSSTGGQDITIQLALAQRTPDCNPTNGIVRVNAMNALPPLLAAQYNSFGLAYPVVNPNGLSHADMTGISYWPNKDYINIWMVHFGVSSAYYPTGTATIYDGIVLGVGNATTGAANPYVLTHEVGHYFGLRHTDEGSTAAGCAQNINCSTDGDFVCDTDPIPINTNGCNPVAINPCTNQLYGNLVYNYMGNSCNTGNVFTAGQKTRMLNTLFTLRSELDTSLGGTSLALVPPGPPVGVPTIGISTALASYCIGAPIVFTATTTNAGVSPNYQWKVNGVNVGMNYFQFTSNTLNSGDTVVCELTSSYNSVCQASNTVTSNSIIVALNSTQAPTITVAAASSLICSGTQATFNAVATNVGPYIPFFEWYVNGVSTGYQTGNGSSTSSYTYYPANGDIVSCRLFANTGCAATPYTFSNQLPVSITPSVVPSISITVDTNHICSGGTVTVSATPVNGGSGAQVYWFVNGGLAVGSGLGPLQLTLTDTCAIHAVLIATGNCVNPGIVLSLRDTIYVDSLITPAVVISASDTNFCPGSPVSFSAISTNGGGNPGYVWFVNGNSTSSNSPAFTYLPTHGDTISCQLTSSFNCFTANPVNSSNIVVQEIDTITASTIFLQGANVDCEGDTVVLAALLNNVGTNVINLKQWVVNGVVHANTDTIVYVLAAGNNIISFSARFSTTPPCMSGDSVTLFSDTIIASPQPPAAIITNYGTHLGANYPDGQNQWYAVGAGVLTGQVNQLLYPAFSGQFYDIVQVGNCKSIPSDTILFTIPTGVSSLQNGQGTFYPNPSRNGYFSTPGYLVGKDAVITSHIGALVKRVKLGKELSLEQEAAGIYFLRIVNDTGSQVYQLVVLQ